MKKLRVLVVEDDANLKFLLMEMLLQLDQIVLGAENGREALGLLQSRRFDLIFSDVDMPLVDGFRLLESVKKRYQIPVVLMSGNWEHEEEALKRGAADFVKKPYSFERIRQIIEKFSGGQK